MTDKSHNRISVVAATVEHARFVADHMRQQDVDECWASVRLRPFEAIVYGMQHTRACWTGVFRNEPFCIFGVTRSTHDKDVGIPWLLATDSLSACSREFLRQNSIYVQAMRREFRELINYVDDRNTVAKRWLEWLGFMIEDERTPLGPDQLPFRRFTMMGFKNRETRGSANV